MVIETMVILIMFDIRNIGRRTTRDQVIPKQVSAFVFSKPPKTGFLTWRPNYVFVGKAFVLCFALKFIRRLILTPIMPVQVLGFFTSAFKIHLGVSKYR